jgi:type II secretory pathway pseudopilin PulG
LNIDETDGTLLHSHEGLARLEVRGRQDQLLKLRKLYQVLRGSSRGVIAIEVIIGLVIMGIVAAAFLSGLATTLNATRIADEHSTAQSLAQSQMEYVKSRGYATDQWSYAVSSSDRSPLDPGSPSWWDADNPPFLSSDDSGYSVVVKAENFDADDDDIVEVPGDDEGIRTITVTVEHGGEGVFTLEDYKVNR